MPWHSWRLLGPGLREIRSSLGNKDIRGTTSPLAFSGGFTALLYSDQEELSMDVATTCVNPDCLLFNTTDPPTLNPVPLPASLWHSGFSLAEAHGLHCPTACGILVPQAGVKSASPALEGWFLTTGPPGMSPSEFFKVTQKVNSPFSPLRSPVP